MMLEISVGERSRYDIGVAEVLPFAPPRRVWANSSTKDRIDGDGVVDFDEDNFSSNSERIAEDADLNDEVIDDFKELHLNDKLYVCSRQGHRAKKWPKIEHRKCIPKFEMRCGCKARFRVKFVLRDLCNKMDALMKKEIAMGDVEGAIGYLAAKKDTDPMFFYKYGTNE
ncbi:hypothetical protein ACH5RR_023506 [Cinchona calisaya]|uniref:Uncharacterized protein n=1 Tax=Cinchona calisaya TaxID=153742 RepID=A0ABD2ZBZ0_9GENT